MAKKYFALFAVVAVIFLYTAGIAKADYTSDLINSIKQTIALLQAQILQYQQSSTAAVSSTPATNCAVLSKQITDAINLYGNSKCGDANYKPSNDINGDKIITPLDLLSSYSMTNAQCLAQLTNPKNVCPVPQPCAVVDVTSQSYPWGYNEFIKVSNAPVPITSLKLGGVDWYNNLGVTYFAKNSDGTTTFKVTQYVSLSGDSYIKQKKSNLVLLDSKNNIVCNSINSKKPIVVLTSPNGGETINTNSQQVFNFTLSNFNSSKFAYQINLIDSAGVSTTIFNNYDANNISITQTTALIPSNIKSGKYKAEIKFMLSDYSVISDTSDNYFSISVCSPICFGKSCGSNDGCGSKCSVTGSCQDGFICRNANCVNITSESLNLGEQKFLFILANFSDTTSLAERGVTIESVKTQAMQLNDSIKMVSANQSWVDFKVVGPYNIGSDICSVNSGNLTDKLKETVKRAITEAVKNEDITNYYNIEVIANFPYSCPVTGGQGFAFNSPIGKVATSKGNIFFRGIVLDTIVDSWVTLHEFGHAIGSSCPIGDSRGTNWAILLTDQTSKPVNLSGFQYDYYSVMGYQGLVFDSINAEKIGWLSDEQVATTNNGTYSLFSTTDSKGKIKALKIPLPGLPYTIYVDYVDKVDSQYGPNIKPGVILRATSGCPSNIFVVTDPHTEMGSQAYQSPLEIGKVYNLWSSGVSLKVNSISDGIASVTVNNSNLNLTQCNDGINNDYYSGSVEADVNDTSCKENGTYNPLHLSELDPVPKCSDYKDNDGDGKIDYPLDLQCYGVEDNSEN